MTIYRCPFLAVWHDVITIMVIKLNIQTLDEGQYGTPVVTTPNKSISTGSNTWSISLRWRHNDHDGVSNHQPYDRLLNRLFGRRSMKTSKLRVTGLCAGKSPVTGEFPAQMASNAENISIWWRHHDNNVHPLLSHWLLGLEIPSPTAFMLWHRGLNTLRSRQNGRHFPDDIFKCIFLNVNA